MMIDEEKTVRPGIREISPVSIYGEKDLRIRCILSLAWKRGVIDGVSGGDDSVDPMCIGRWGERMREFILEVGFCMSKKRFVILVMRK